MNGVKPLPCAAIRWLSTRFFDGVADRAPAFGPTAPLKLRPITTGSAAEPSTTWNVHAFADAAQSTAASEVTPVSREMRRCTGTVSLKRAPNPAVTEAVFEWSRPDSKKDAPVPHWITRPAAPGVNPRPVSVTSWWSVSFVSGDPITVGLTGGRAGSNVSGAVVIGPPTSSVSTVTTQVPALAAQSKGSFVLIEYCGSIRATANRFTTKVPSSPTTALRLLAYEHAPKFRRAFFEHSSTNADAPGVKPEPSTRTN